VVALSTVAASLLLGVTAAFALARIGSVAQPAGWLTISACRCSRRSPCCRHVPADPRARLYNHLAALACRT